MKFTSQHDQMDCGPACLRMVAAAHGKTYPLEYIREKTFLSREGASLLGISEAAEHIGLETFSAKLSISKLIQQKALLPCVRRFIFTFYLGDLSKYITERQVSVS